MKKTENLQSKIYRLQLNLFPPYRRTGARVIFIAGDLSEVRIKLPLNRKTKNYVGTLFGGSIYAAVDPIYMVMLIRLLGKALLSGTNLPPSVLKSPVAEHCSHPL